MRRKAASRPEMNYWHRSDELILRLANPRGLLASMSRQELEDLRSLIDDVLGDAAVKSAARDDRSIRELRDRSLGDGPQKIAWIGTRRELAQLGVDLRAAGYFKQGFVQAAAFLVEHFSYGGKPLNLGTMERYMKGEKAGNFGEERMMEWIARLPYLHRCKL